jgi:hypothetical protein
MDKEKLMMLLKLNGDINEREEIWVKCKSCRPMHPCRQKAYIHSIDWINDTEAGIIFGHDPKSTFRWREYLDIATLTIRGHEIGNKWTGMVV